MHAAATHSKDHSSSPSPPPCPQSDRLLAALLDRLSDPERLAEVGDWTIECETEAELLGRVQDALP